MGGMGLIFTPVIVRCLLGPLSLSGPMTSISWTNSYAKNPIRRYNLPPAAHLPPQPHPSHSPTPLYTQSMILH